MQKYSLILRDFKKIAKQYKISNKGFLEWGGVLPYDHKLTGSKQCGSTLGDSQGKMSSILKA